MIEYRKEVDGLRAVAVIPVIFFHAGFSGFSGGFIGVDVFFVISGYLITSIIIHDFQKQKFSIINFYERRARRILPALSFMLLFTTLAAYLLMPAYLLKLYSQSLVSVASFLSNVYFYLTSGYFSTAAEEKPLLHTWSLAVEEQYYLFYPLLLMVLWKKGKTLIQWVLVVITLVSLALAQYLAELQLVNANFYLIFSRAWELMLGSLLAFTPHLYGQASHRTKQFISMLGLLMIICSIVLFDKYTPFPSLYTLIPVLGTCLLIAYTDSKTIVGKLLSSPAFVGVGLISYSLYLWHQPFLAFLRLKSIGEPQLVHLWLAIILTFLLAFISWKYVEAPFRNKKRFSRVLIFKLSTASLVACLAIGISGHIGGGFENRFAPEKYQDSMVWSPKRSCHQKSPNDDISEQACSYFGQNITWAVFGDSHIVEPAFALAKNLQPDDIGIKHFSFKGCMPALTIDAQKPGCTQWINNTLDYLESSAEISNVLLAFRHSYYLFGSQVHQFPSIPNEPFRVKLNNPNQYADELIAREAYWQSFEKIVERLTNANKTVYVLFPIPELPMSIHKAAAPFSVINDQTLVNLNKTTSVEYYLARHAFILNKLKSFSSLKNVVPIEPLKIICNSEYCPAIKDEQALYYDDNHLSIAGAQLIADVITEKVTNKS